MSPHALVTGAGTGIGRAVTLALAARGMTVHALGRRSAPLTSLVDAAGTLPGAVVPHAVDAGEAGSVERVLAQVDGRLAVAVSSAGTFRRASVADLPADSWDAQLHGNLTTAFHTLRAASARMTDQEPVDGCRGHLFTLNSGAGVVGFPGGAAYAAAKHGLRGLVESLRLELAGRAVNITDLVVTATVESEMSAGRDVETIPAEAVAHTVLACLDLPGAATWDRVDVAQLR